MKRIILLRGAVELGKIYSDERIAYGPALVNAYLNEEKMAETSRIIVPIELIVNAKEKADDKEIGAIEYLTYKPTDADFYVINSYMLLKDEDDNELPNQTIAKLKRESEKYDRIKKKNDYAIEQIELFGKR